MGLYATSYRQKGLGGGGGVGNEYGEYKALESISNRSFQKGVMVNPARVIGGAPVRAEGHDKPVRSPIPPGVVVPPIHHAPSYDDMPPPARLASPSIAPHHSPPSSRMDLANAWNTRPPSHHSANSILPVPIRGPQSHDAWNPYRSPSQASKDLPPPPSHDVHFALHDNGPVPNDSIADFDPNAMQWGHQPAPYPAMYSPPHSDRSPRKLVRRSHTTQRPPRGMGSMSSSGSHQYPEDDGNFGFYDPGGTLMCFRRGQALCSLSVKADLRAGPGSGRHKSRFSRGGDISTHFWYCVTITSCLYILLLAHLQHLLILCLTMHAGSNVIQADSTTQSYKEARATGDAV
ncbi:hypothetical protein CPB85DRAFT_221242 [Mucidula mucida]|nr:hypothetical protein CPB85DRAFT_221242 [Mucidula mucida]